MKKHKHHSKAKTCVIPKTSGMSFYQWLSQNKNIKRTEKLRDKHNQKQTR